MRNTYRLPLVAVAAVGLALAGCATSNAPVAATTPAVAPPPAPVAEPVLKGVGLDLAGIDPSVKPCDDFYSYAGGTWMKNNPIPAAEVMWGSFNLLDQRNTTMLRSILEEAAANRSAPKGSNLQKVGDFYATAMDSAAINQAGIAPLKPELDKVAAIKSLDGIQTVLSRHITLQTGAFFSMYVGQDDKISSQYAINLYQGGLSLPSRDYYLDNDARSKSIRAAFQTYLINTFKMAGAPEAQAKKDAASVLRLETRLAKASRSPVDLRDPYANYNKMTVAAAAKAYPNLNLPQIMGHLGVSSAKEVIVGQPAFFKELNTMLKAEPLADLKTYLRWHLITSVTAALPQAYGDEAFRFAQVLTGAKKRQPRWKRMLRATDAALGEAFGQVYVEKAFPPEAKAKAMEMVMNIKEAFGQHVKSLDWMSEATKQEALKKLSTFTVKIGYPDKWKDYSTLNISRDSYLQNVLAARQWENKYNFSKFGKPVDRTEWGMTPPTVNAYYNPPLNEIVFPAGIMQPPFFDPNADDAVNYGAMGAIIGHEITHGFDDQGRQYDAEGNLKDWWTKEDAEKFDQRAAILGAQFDAFSPLDSVHVNGKLTMGENLADLGGLSIAFSALQNQLQKKYGNGPRPKYDGLTPEQRFFLSYGQAWRTNMRPELLRQLIATDPHSPGQYRTNGPLQNMPQFYEAFGCPEDAKMVKAQNMRATIW